MNEKYLTAFAIFSKTVDMYIEEQSAGEEGISAGAVFFGIRDAARAAALKTGLNPRELERVIRNLIEGGDPRIQPRREYIY